VGVHGIGAAGLAADLETGSDGRFRAAGLPEGEYRIELSRANYVTASLSLHLPAAPVLFRLTRLGSIAGQVTDLQGRPAAGVTVFPVVESPAGFFRRILPQSTARTDDRGQYRLYGLAPGRYAVAVSWASLNPRSVSGAYLYPNNARPELFGISGGEEYRGIDFQAPLNASYRVSGVVQLPTPEARASVTLAAADQPSLAVATGQADKDGRFSLEGIPPGSYELFAVAPAVGFGGRGVLLGSEPSFGRIHVEVAGQDVEGVSISLDRGRAARFVLRAASPRAAKECPSSGTLVLTPVEDWGATLNRSVEVSSDKEQVVDGLAPGRYYLEVTGLGERCFSPADKVLDLTARPESGPVPLAVTAAGFIVGRLNAAAARPQDFAVVLLRSETTEVGQPVQIALPDAKSGFTFPNLRPGRYRIAAKPLKEASSAWWAADHERMFEIDVPAGGAVDLDLPVPTTGELP